MIRDFKSEDIDICVQLLIETYNREPWNNRWTIFTAEKYLKEFLANNNFVGFVICEDTHIVGAVFAHRKTWWTNDELYVDEICIKPQMQRRGFGKALLTHLEQYAQINGLVGLGLITNRDFPANTFYQKNGYRLVERLVFMNKELR